MFEVKVVVELLVLLSRRQMFVEQELVMVESFRHERAMVPVGVSSRRLPLGGGLGRSMAIVSE
jgi:hypothetical protein